MRQFLASMSPSGIPTLKYPFFFIAIVAIYQRMPRIRVRDPVLLLQLLLPLSVFAASLDIRLFVRVAEKDTPIDGPIPFRRASLE